MAFTPEEISQIISEFFNVVGTRQYIGARYVPIFGRKNETSIQWDNTAPYEPLTIVLYQGNSYTSRQYVPAGVDILNQEFWANTGNYNAQVEQYRQEVLAFDSRITNVEDGIERVEGDVTEALAEIDEKVAVPQAAIDNYMKFQSDFHNNVINPVRVQQLPAPPSGYRAQGFTIDANGYVYVAYTGSDDAILRKYSQFTGDDSVLETLSQLVLTGNKHANSINLYANSHLLIADTGSISNKITVVQLSDFTLQTAITLPYHGINNVAYFEGLNSAKFLIGKNSYGHNLQLYQFDGLTRAEAYADMSVAIPCECSYSQGCCVNNYMFYEVFSYSADRATLRNYVEMSAPFASCFAMPCVFPIGMTGYEFEDLCVYGNHMYSNTNYAIWDFGTQIVSLVDQYRVGSWYNDLRFDRVEGIARSYISDTAPVPATFEIPIGYANVLSRIPERCRFRFQLQEASSNRCQSPWYTLTPNHDFTAFLVRGTSITIYNLRIDSRSGSILNLTFSKADIAANGAVTVTQYPNFGVNSFKIELAIA